jgi:hypothetical protein
LLTFVSNLTSSIFRIKVRKSSTENKQYGCRERDDVFKAWRRYVVPKHMATTYQTTRYYNPQDLMLEFHRHENLKSHEVPVLNGGFKRFNVYPCR